MFKDKSTNKQIQLRGLSDRAIEWLDATDSLKLLRSWIEQSAIDVQPRKHDYVIKFPNESSITIHGVSAFAVRKQCAQEGIKIKSVRKVSGESR